MSLADAYSARWQDTDWDGRSPGTFAVVIGVSRYDHLPGGGGEPAPDAFDLPQLHVSALTAYRFWQWLRDEYRLPGCPLVRGWLLLSPTAAEVAQEPVLAGIPVEDRPTFDRCAAAVADLYDAADRLEPDVARASRLLFFFSGHGMEVDPKQQVLLPCDYLRPPAGLVNRALSVTNLLAGLSVLPARTHLFFLDACRNDHVRLRLNGASLHGMEVLNTYAATYANPDLEAAVLYATATGTQAFQPTDAANGPSLFGRALLEGLDEPPADVRKCEGPTCAVGMRALSGYIKRRVTQLLAEHGATVKQPVRLGGEFEDVVVTEVAAGGPEAAPPPPVAHTRRSAFDVATDASALGTAGFGANTDVGDPFADEAMASIWAGRRVISVGHDDTVGDAVPHTLLRVERHRTAAYRLLLRMDGGPAPAYRVELGDSWSRFTCTLPWTGFGTRYVLEVGRDDQGRLAEFEVDLDEANGGLLGRAAQAWRIYRDVDAAGAARRLDDSAIEAVAAGESESPLPAVIAALLQLGLRRSLRRDVLEDVAMLYPGWGDLRVLVVEALLRADPALGTQTIAGVLTQLRGCPVPFTTEMLGFADAQCNYLSRRLAVDPAAAALIDDFSTQIRAVLRRLRPGGLFRVLQFPAAD
jgi:hypothetical protein